MENSAIDLLAKGIELLTEGLNQLRGNNKTTKVSKKREKSNKQNLVEENKQPVSTLTQISTPTPTSTPTSTPTTSSTSNEGVQRPARWQPVKLGQRPNLYVDDLTENIKDIEIDNKIDRSNKALRRPPVKFVKVTCVRCGKNEEVTLDLAPKRIGLDKNDMETTNYICNNCIVGRK